MNMRTQWARFSRALQISGSAVIMSTGLWASSPVSAQAACGTTAAPPTTYGQVKQSLTVATAGTYRVWSRIKAPTTASNAYYFQIDNGCTTIVGDSASIPPNVWTWVNYTGGNTTAYHDVTLTAGTHQLTYTGKEAGVLLDRVLFISDTSCEPKDTGDNCADADGISPSVAITSPAAGSGITKGSTLPINANATDNVAVTKVEFYVDGTLKNTDVTAPYGFTWDTSAATVATHTLIAKAYDAATNVTTSAPVNITVSAADTPPTVSLLTPVSGTAITIGGTVDITAQASDNSGVARVEFYVDNVLKSTDTTAPYAYSWPTSGVAAGSHSISAKAYDAGDKVAASTVASISVLSGAITVGINGDSNGDGKVNSLDFSLLVENDGKNFSAADYNKDGIVGAADLAILLSRWTW